MKNISKLLIFTFAAFFIFSGSAYAHVTVKPSSSAPEAWETYTLKVPVEKETATTKVTLKVPEGVTFESYQPVPGWKVTTESDKDGHVKSVTWAATDEGIAAGQFQQFSFVAQNPKEETKVAWDAFQYYEDGEIVEWSGDEGSDLPHSVTEITVAPKADAEPADHGHKDEADTNDSTATDNSKDSATTEGDGNQTLIITLAVISLILSIVALFAALRKTKK
ncbi:MULTISPECIES: YcnI family copper-binding membrane protein [Peribacillus]|uniref:YcnI family copper-binding membrane protein n=1 Tax=Peribacillus TaxID=2675229 RepID=UPI001F4DDB1A|nr:MULTISPECIES: YcnI family protein [unclassified Peribacillus]MCK1985365.1 YcnI family protein [Peribacillus sp. Aquil_B1]MCK2007901.1 YcnI family protein [Peribacillus sp. Aquil_B8]